MLIGIINVMCCPSLCVADYVKRYATEDALRDDEASSSSASEMSELSDDEDQIQDMEL